jgi:hypothetical protein
MTPPRRPAPLPLHSKPPTSAPTEEDEEEVKAADEADVQMVNQPPPSSPFVMDLRRGLFADALPEDKAERELEVLPHIHEAAGQY